MNCLSRAAFYLSRFWNLGEVEKIAASEEPKGVLPSLPGEVLEILFKDLSLKGLCRVALVSRKWHQLTQVKLDFCKLIFLPIQVNMKHDFPLRARPGILRILPYYEFSDPNELFYFKMQNGFPKRCSSLKAEFAFFLEWIYKERVSWLGKSGLFYPLKMRVQVIKPPVYDRHQKTIETLMQHVDNVLLLRERGYLS